MKNATFLEFLAGYCEALLWSSSCTTDDGEDVPLDQYELSTAGLASCRADCLAFFTANQGDIDRAAAAYPGREQHGGYALAGHDFALTRNGDGAGYWDGDLPDELGDRLTAAAEGVGPCWPYLGDDGLIYIC